MLTVAEKPYYSNYFREKVLGGVRTGFIKPYNLPPTPRLRSKALLLDSVSSVAIGQIMLILNAYWLTQAFHSNLSQLMGGVVP